MVIISVLLRRRSPFSTRILLPDVQHRNQQAGPPV